MKLENHLTTFLKDTVNLNQTRIDTLKQRVETITDFVKQLDEFKELFIEAESQGSWAHHTIIKPVKNGEFDADLVVFLNENEEWEPKDYIDNLYKAFKENKTYGDKVSRNKRCVTIDYAGDFHLDVVPCIRKEDFWGNVTEWILNSSSNSREQTNPKGYLDWFDEKNGCTENNNLIKVIRLLKYLRDYKQTFSAKSILLTTILANRVGAIDSIIGSGFSELSTSLREILNRLDAYLQERPEMPTISNPSLSSEDFNRHWNQQKYTNFRDCIHRYSEWTEDAYLEPNRDESILKWRRIFGDDYANGIEIADSKKAHLMEARENLSHVKPLPWPLNPLMSIKLKVSIYDDEEGTYLGTLRSDGPELEHGTWIKFEIDQHIENKKNMHWQIVNTGEIARRETQLRGGFEQSGLTKWEHVSYRGTHWVECFLIKDNICIARSGRFYVNVK